MGELKVTHILKNDLGFSDFSIKKIKKFHNHLLEYNKRYNLISKNTENSIWSRHILDSAQLVKFIDFSKKVDLVDFGSGAGFPGLILSFYEPNSGFHVKLYEKSPVKRDFLMTIKNILNLDNISIENNVYEIIHNVDLNNPQAMKYVQIHREVAKTSFSEHQVLQMIDIS